MRSKKAPVEDSAQAIDFEEHRIRCLEGRRKQMALDAAVEAPGTQQSHARTRGRDCLQAEAEVEVETDARRRSTCIRGTHRAT